jgi:hypothetical protein
MANRNGRSLARNKPGRVARYLSRASTTSPTSTELAYLRLHRSLTPCEAGVDLTRSRENLDDLRLVAAPQRALGPLGRAWRGHCTVPPTTWFFSNSVSVTFPGGCKVLVRLGLKKDLRQTKTKKLRRRGDC